MSPLRHPDGRGFYVCKSMTTNCWKGLDVVSNLQEHRDADVKGFSKQQVSSAGLLRPVSGR